MSAFRPRPLALSLASLFLSLPGLALGHVVNDAGDAPDANIGDGICATAANVCTLRAALQESNVGNSKDSIQFAIGSGAVTITPASALPTIVEEIEIDGYSQPGASANTLAVGSDAQILVRIDGSAAGGAANGLQLGTGSDGSSVRGLAITGFGGYGIALRSTYVTLAGNLIGVLGNGSAAPNGGGGLYIYSAAADNVIGGPAPADRNVIAGNGGNAITLRDVGSDRNVVRNNYLGTAPDGITPLPGSGGYALSVYGGVVDSVIRDNVITGKWGGIAMSNGVFTTSILANRIGVGADGVTNLAAGADATASGIAIGSYIGLTALVNDARIGGIAAGEGNTIAHWPGAGVLINRDDALFATSYNIAIRGNSIFGNGGLGIDLADSATGAGIGQVNPNDAGDLDGLANDFQNYPVINSITTDVAGSTVAFTLDSRAGHTYAVDAYASPSCDASGHGEGQTWLGSVDVTTDVTGHAVGVLSGLPGGLAAQAITLTATMGSTSEFSACAPASVGATVSAVPVSGVLGKWLALLLVGAAGVAGQWRARRRA